MIFIHAPKTGGTSIRKSVGKYTNKNHQRLSDLWPVEDKTFAVVRNPYDRAVSMAAHVITRGTEQQLTPQSFKDWWKNSPDIPVERGKESPINFRDPQWDFYTIDGQVKITHLIEFDQIEKGIKSLFGVDLVHRNKSHREKDYRIYYDDEMYTLITQKYLEDILTFNYYF